MVQMHEKAEIHSACNAFNCQFIVKKAKAVYTVKYFQMREKYFKICPSILNQAGVTIPARSFATVNPGIRSAFSLGLVE
jgi:hypothetical protein